MARYLSGITKQLQEVSDLFTSRYGKGSDITELARRTLGSAVLLERNFELLKESQGKAMAAGRN